MAGIDGILKDGDKRRTGVRHCDTPPHSRAAAPVQPLPGNRGFLYIREYRYRTAQCARACQQPDFLQRLRITPLTIARVIFRRVPVKRFVFPGRWRYRQRNDRTVVLRRDLFRQCRRRRCGIASVSTREYLPR